MPYTINGAGEAAISFGGRWYGNPHWNTAVYPQARTDGGGTFDQRYYTSYSDAVFEAHSSLGSIDAIIGDANAANLGHGENGKSTLKINGGDSSVDSDLINWDASSVFSAEDDTLSNDIVNDFTVSATDDGMRGGTTGATCNPRKQASADDYGRSGVWSMSCAGVRCLVPIEPSGPYPSDAADAVREAPDILNFAVKTYARIGARITLSASYGGLSVSASGTVKALFEISDQDCAGNWNTTGVGGYRPGTGDGAAPLGYPQQICNSAVSMTFAPSPDMPAYSGTATHDFVDGPGNHITETVTVTAGGGGGSASGSGASFKAAGGFSGAFARVWSVSGRILGTDGILALPGLKVNTPPQGQATFASDGTPLPRITQADASSGSFTASGAQRSYSYACGAYFAGAGASLSPPVPADFTDAGGVIGFSIDKTTLPAAIRDLVSPRILLHGPQFAGPTVTQASSQVLGGAFTVPYSLTPAPYALPDSATSAGLKGLEWKGASGRGYRYLRVSAAYFSNLPAGTSSVNTPITIMGRTWSKDWQGNVIKNSPSMADVTLDLTTFDGAVDGRAESEWPLTRISDPSPPAGRPLKGIFTDSVYPLANITGISFGGIPAPVHAGDPVPTLHIGGLTLLRMDAAPVLTFLDAYNFYRDFYPAADEDGGTQISYSPFFTGLSDGIPSAEATGFVHSVTSSGVDSYSVVTIGGLSDAINGVYEGYAANFPTDGWSATGGQAIVMPDADGFAPLVGGFLNVSSPAVFIGGAGMLLSGSSAVSPIDASSVGAELVFDGFIPNGLAPEVFSGIPAHGTLYAAVRGMVFTTAGKPASGVTVQAGPSTGTNLGQYGLRVTIGNGTYLHTGTPGIPTGSADVLAMSGDAPYPHAGIAVTSRRILRVCLSVAQNAAYGFCEGDGPRGYLYVSSANKVMIYNLSDISLARVGPALTMVDSWARARIDNRLGTLFLLGVQGSEFVVAASSDSGATATEVKRVTANSAAIERQSAKGTVVFLYGDASDNVMVELSQDGGTTFSAAVAVVDDTATPLVGKIIDTGEDERANGSMYMILKTGDNTNIYASDTMGATWIQKVS